MATLFNTKIKDTYQSLLKLEDNTILTTTSKNITDGLGNASPLYLSTTQVRIGSNSGSAMYWDNTNNRLGIGTSSPTQSIETPNAIVFASANNDSKTTLKAFDAATGNIDFTNEFMISRQGTNLVKMFFNNTIGIGGIGSAAKLGVRGSGSTSATTSLLVQNSIGTTALSVNDASNVLVGTATDNGYKLNVNGSINIAGGNKLNFSNGSAQCWITNEGGTGLGSRSILIPGTGGGGGFIFYSDGGGPITSFDASGDSIQIRAGSSSVTGIMSINKSAASGYGGGTFIYYQSVFGNRMYTFGNPSNERGDEGGSHTKIAAGAAGFLGNGGHVYLEAGAKGTQVGSVDGNIIIAATRGNVAIGLTTPTARLQVQGSGSTSATTSLLVQNSGGTNLLQMRDDGAMVLGTKASGLGTIVVTTHPTNLTKVVMQNEYGAPIIKQVSTDTIYFGGQAITAIQGNSYLSFNAPLIYGDAPQGASSAASFKFFCQTNSYGGSASSPARGFHIVGDLTLQSAGYVNAFEISPTFNFDTSAGRIAKGIYYNPDVSSIKVGDKHYGIQTTSGGAYINTTTPQASACLQADSTTQGFLPPRVTTAQKNAISSPSPGLQVYDTTLNQMSYFNGTTWVNF